jgi:hypothetical protein
LDQGMGGHDSDDSRVYLAQRMRLETLTAGV